MPCLQSKHLKLRGRRGLLWHASEDVIRQGIKMIQNDDSCRFNKTKCKVPRAHFAPERLEPTNHNGDESRDRRSSAAFVDVASASGCITHYVALHGTCSFSLCTSRTSCCVVSAPSCDGMSSSTRSLDFSKVTRTKWLIMVWEK